MFYLLMAVLNFGTASAQIAPSYDDNFSAYLLSGRADENGSIANVYNISAVSPDNDLETNIRCLFYPNADPVCNTYVR